MNFDDYFKDLEGGQSFDLSSSDNDESEIVNNDSMISMEEDVFSAPENQEAPQETGLILFDEEVLALRNADKNLSKRFPDEWGIRAVKRDSSGKVVLVQESDPEHRRAKAVIDNVRKNKSTSSFLYAQMPFICRGHECPYGGCDEYGLSCFDGERCIKEIAFLIDIADRIEKKMQINPFDNQYIIDSLQIKSLIYDYLLEYRIENYLSKSDIIVQATVGMTEAGPIETDVENPVFKIKKQLHKEINRLENDLKLTRKSNEDENKNAIHDYLLEASQFYMEKKKKDTFETEGGE